MCARILLSLRQKGRRLLADTTHSLAPGTPSTKLSGLTHANRAYDRRSCHTNCGHPHPDSSDNRVCHPDHHGRHTPSPSPATMEEECSKQLAPNVRRHKTGNDSGTAPRLGKQIPGLPIAIPTGHRLGHSCPHARRHPCPNTGYHHRWHIYAGTTPPVYTGQPHESPPPSG